MEVCFTSFVKIFDPPAFRLLEGVIAAVQKVPNLHAQRLRWTVTTELAGVNFGLDNLVFTDALPSLRQWAEDLRGLEVRVTSLQCASESNNKIIDYNNSGPAGIGNLTLAVHPPFLSQPDALALHRYLQAEFQQTAGYSISSEEHLRDSKAVIGQLHSALQEITREIARVQADGVATLGRERSVLEKLFEERRAKLEAESSAALAAQREELNERAKQLEAKAKEFDLRDEQLVRRKMLEAIQQELKAAQSPSVSRETTSKRNWIRGVVIGIEIVAASAFAVAASSLLNSGEKPWYSFAAVAIPFGTFFSTAIWFLRWEDRWFRDHANQEFLASRYRADMLRASWTAELAAELQKGKGEIPPELIQAMTRGLFVPSLEAPTEHPLEQVIKLLKRGTELNIKRDELAFRAHEPKKDND
jgi:hypothetical protein